MVLEMGQPDLEAECSKQWIYEQKVKRGKSLAYPPSHNILYGLILPGTKGLEADKDPSLMVFF